MAKQLTKIISIVLLALLESSLCALSQSQVTYPVQPVVIAAEMPKSVGIFGMVWLHVTVEDGLVVDVHAIRGLPDLVSAATANVKTWRMAEQRRAEFDVTYRYIQRTRQGCDQDYNDTLILDLPSYVEVATAFDRGFIYHCDPAMMQPAEIPFNVKELSGSVTCRNCSGKTNTSQIRVEAQLQGTPGSPIHTVMTGPDGRFRFNLPNGKYFVRTSDVDYMSATASVNVDPGAPATSRVELVVDKVGDSRRDPGATVDGAALPTYPETARASEIQGDVLIAVKTDGERVLNAQPISGPRELAAAAIENVKSWKFWSNDSHELSVTYRYRLTHPCGANDSEVVIANFPSEIEVRGCR